MLLAMGFVGPERPGLLTELGVELTDRGNVARNADFETSVPGVFVAGDMGRGQSLIVWAIAEGRAAAAGVDRFLMGHYGFAGAYSADGRAATLVTFVTIETRDLHRRAFCRSPDPRALIAEVGAAGTAVPGCQ